MKLDLSTPSTPKPQAPSRTENTAKKQAVANSAPSKKQKASTSTAAKNTVKKNSQKKVKDISSDEESYNAGVVFAQRMMMWNTVNMLAGPMAGYYY